MFFRFPPDVGGIPIAPRSSSALASVNTRASFASLAGYSSPYWSRPRSPSAALKPTTYTEPDLN